MIDWSLIVAGVAAAIAVMSLIWNWRHSESLFRRAEYPAVAWYLPKIEKHNDTTAIKTSIRNFGEKEITSIFLGAYLCKGLNSKPWLKSSCINDLPIREELLFTLTEQFENDVQESFGGLFYENGWQFKGRVSRYMLTLRLEYLPILAESSYLKRTGYYLIEPVLQNKVIKTWEIRQVSKLRRFVFSLETLF